MLRINAVTNAKQAMSYYLAADYYLSDHETQGVWHGKGADRLGLSGTVTREAWESLCRNEHPASRERLTQRNQSDRRIGFDLTFSVPKSISLLYAFTQDKRIVEAFEASVEETMRDIEAEMKTRVRTKGADTDRVTGEATWATFKHFTSRPEDGLPDSHLHAHVVCLNHTFDPVEQRFKAAQLGDIKRDGEFHEAMFDVRMAERMAKLGVPMERVKGGYEVAGFSRATIDKFSRRTIRIERMAAALGITDAKEKAELGVKTRHRKDSNYTFAELAGIWRSWLTDDETSRMLVHQHRLESGIDVFKDSPAVAKDAVQASLEHLFERSSVVPERKVIAHALKRSIGNASTSTVLDAYARAGVIVGERDGRRVATTREVLAEEMSMIRFARAGRGTCAPLAPKGYQLKDKRLSDSQRQAVERILTSPDRVILLRGAAGVGKTTIMKEAIAGIEAGGSRVFTFAPSAAAGRGVLREEVSDKADTVALLLKNEQLHPELENNVIWIDEAGLAGTKTLRQVFDLAERVNARVVLSGDRRQHGSVERGAALRLLETEAGLVPAESSAIRRQSGEYREVVQALADGRTKDGFEQLDKLGWIHELPEETRYARLAMDYAAAVAAMRPDQRALVVVPTHREGAKVNDAVRAELKLMGLLGKQDRKFPTLERTDFTEAERADPLTYDDGQVVVLNQNARGFKRGQRVAVKEGAPPVPLNYADRFQIYRTGTVSLAAGDDIRITANGESKDGHRLNNGAIYKVKGFTRSGDIRLANGWTLDRDFGFISHGFVTTSHSSQGKSVEQVFICASEESHAASSREQLYVSVSRGKTKATIYTDDAKALLDAVSRSDERLSATELVAGKRSEHARQQDRGRDAAKQVAREHEHEAERGR
ncbi:MAG: MobF family relaxase [Phycisphaerales bacterium]